MKRKMDFKLDQLEIDENLLNSGVYRYFTNITFMKKETRLNIFLPDKKDIVQDYIDKITDGINWLLINMNYIEDEIRQSHLIDLKNSNWLEEGEKKISSRQFMKRVVLESISFDVKDSELYSINLEYNDDDIFWGHTINVEIADNKVRNIEI